MTIKQKAGTLNSILHWWVSGRGISDTFFIFLAKVVFILYRIVRFFLAPLIKLKPSIVGNFLIKDVVAQNSYGNFYCRARDEDIDLLDEEYEKEALEKVKSLLTPGGVFVDVGANIGKYAILASKIAGPGGKVLAIEPHSGNFEILRKNKELNNIDNLVLTNCASWDKTEEIKLFEGPFSGQHSAFISGEKYTLVKAFRLDDILDKASIQKVNIIKIDAEDADSKVLSGANEILKNSSPKVFFEARNEKMLEECKVILERHGYTVQNIGPTMYFAQKN